MPELPEVESARPVIERAALGRRIVDVDDSDTYVCRPHQPGEIRDALVGRRLTAAHRRGKSMWCDTSGVGRSRTAGPTLGIHLGMSGKIVVADGRRHEIDGGDYWERGRAPGRLPLSAVLADLRRRLARCCWSTRAGSAGCGSIPPIETLGPDAARDHRGAVPGRARPRVPRR